MFAEGLAFLLAKGLSSYVFKARLQPLSTVCHKSLRKNPPDANDSQYIRCSIMVVSEQIAPSAPNAIYRK